MRWPVYSAIVPQLVRARDLQSAIALKWCGDDSSRVIGPVVAGLIIASLGSHTFFCSTPVCR